MFCRKAGLPEADTRSVITSHRARATIATQLFNAREPMTLFELQQWLGHRSPHSTQYYAKITPTTLTKVYTDAGYFGRNVRLIELLVDQGTRKPFAAGPPRPGSPGCTMVWGMATAPTTTLTNVRTAWRAPSARFISRRNPATGCCWKRKPTCCACSKQSYYRKKSKRL